MLPQNVFIFNPASIGGGNYTIDVFFQDTSKAKFLNVGDRITDTSANVYEVTILSGTPNVDGGTVTFSFITNDVLPQVDVDFDSIIGTPGQDDLGTEVQTGGELSSISIFNATNYEYTITGTWVNSAEANKAAVGDLVTDFNGKEFTITFIDGVSGFGVPFRATETEKVGESPVPGGATLYRGSPNFGYFQGSFVRNDSLLRIRNRDNAVTDINVGGSQLGADDEGGPVDTNVTKFDFVGAGVTASQTSPGEVQVTIPGGGGGTGQFLKQMQNNTGSPIAAGVPVSKKSDGSIVPADSDAADGQAYCGVTSEVIAASGGLGDVAVVGQNIVGAITALGFTPGTDVFLSETAGTYTDNPASFTGGDDSIIKVGLADCSAGVASATANDLIMFTEVLLRP
jgi:hypothetical protein